MNLKIASNFTIPAIDYGNQGNAILGIRNAGKTYTAMKAAEELLEAGIPIIVFDPVGVWHNLKIGTGSNKGYSIVTAGGDESDIRLTKDNAVDVVRAAMKENVSLVIDLFCKELINKSTWIKIVQEVVDMLVLENKPYGIRHIFIEEASEFIPQRIQPQQSRVYASIERLARIGRNCGLGYTIINQRAEEVNKAILELCEFSLLHKQVGKNSMLSIQKWMNLLQIDNTQEIIKSIPTLDKGQCWVVGESTQPTLIQVLPKKTFHPDPKKKNDSSVVVKPKVDVSVFVERLNKSLEKPEKKAIETLKNMKYEVVHIREKELEIENKDLKQTIHILQSRESVLEGVRVAILNHVNEIHKLLDIAKNPGKPTPGNGAKTTEHFTTKMPAPLKLTRPTNGNGKLSKCAFAIMSFLAQYPDRAFTKAQVGIMTSYSPGSGGFNNSISELNSLGLIDRSGGRISTNKTRSMEEFIGEVMPREYSIETYVNKLGKCERQIYQVLLKFPREEFTKDGLAAKTESVYSPGSGGFSNALSTLNTLELIHRKSGRIKLNPELLELMNFKK